MHWFGVTAAQTLTEVTETHKQTDHMNQQGLAGRVMIKQAQSHLQFLLNSVFFFSQTSKRNCHPRCETHSAALPKTSYTLETQRGRTPTREGKPAPGTQERGENQRAEEVL